MKLTLFFWTRKLTLANECYIDDSDNMWLVVSSRVV